MSSMTSAQAKEMLEQADDVLSGRSKWISMWRSIGVVHLLSKTDDEHALVAAIGALLNRISDLEIIVATMGIGSDVGAAALDDARRTVRDAR